MRRKTEAAPATEQPQGKAAASALYAEAARSLQAVLHAHQALPGDSDMAGARSFIGGLIHQLQGREREIGTDGT